ncbi:MAG: ABC transporter permease [Chloroflexi bacterium]|nr:ABC transporter permease [Chloroflexota bacterium]
MTTTSEVGALGGELEQAIRPRRHPLRSLATVARQNPLGVIGFLIIFILTIVAIFAPLIAPFDVGDFRAGQPKENPSWTHLFGTDGLGHDVFSRVVHGTRISMTIAVLAVGGGTIIATVLGIISGYMGGIIDSVIQRIVDTAIAFPILLLLLILAQVLGPSMRTVIIAVGIAFIAPVTRVVRGAVLSERNNQYVEAARALGATTPRILLRHIAPNVVALAIIIATTLLGTAILAEAALSFLGLGIPVPNPSWGTDVSLARASPPYHIWWAFFPGAAITLTVLGFNLLGDSLRDIFDPRLRGRL